MSLILDLPNISEQLDSGYAFFGKTTTEVVLCPCRCILSGSIWCWIAPVLVTFDHLVKMMSVRFLHLNVATFPWQWIHILWGDILRLKVLYMHLPLATPISPNGYNIHLSWTRINYSYDGCKWVIFKLYIPSSIINWLSTIKEFAFLSFLPSTPPPSLLHSVSSCMTQNQYELIDSFFIWCINQSWPVWFWGHKVSLFGQGELLQAGSLSFWHLTIILWGLSYLFVWGKLAEMLRSSW